MCAWKELAVLFDDATTSGAVQPDWRCHKRRFYMNRRQRESWRALRGLCGICSEDSALKRKGEPQRTLRLRRVRGEDQALPGCEFVLIRQDLYAPKLIVGGCNNPAPGTVFRYE